jgi:aminobenzoyl-glutamate utilization protein B
MKRRFISMLLIALISFPLIGAGPATVPYVDVKSAAVSDIEKHEADMIKLSDEIWAYAETALRETKSSKALADYAEAQGFQVQRGVAEMPTAFIATYGQGHPIIGILGEYDALPGISQKAQPQKEALEAGKPGHGCGHNLFGVASLGAAMAIKDLIASGKLKGTIRFYGTPAEESVGGKVYMARAGLFKDLDVCLAWHPETDTRADTSSTQAMVDFIVEFKGKAAHAAFDPWNGRSAVDGMEIFNYSLNLMREHVRPTVRIHYTVLKGGDVPNVVPEYAKVWVWLRDSKKDRVDELLDRVMKMAEGAAMAAGVESKVTVQAGSYEMNVNMEGAKLIYANMLWLGPLKFTEQEHQFAKEIQKATGVEQKGLVQEIAPLNLNPGEPEGGSTDVADVSWNVPTLHFSVITAPINAPWHAWPVVACGGMSIGHKGMMYASKTMAATVIDLFLNPKEVHAIQAEFAQKTKGVVYKPYIPEGPPPVPADVK